MSAFDMSPQAPREVSGENIVKQEKRQRDTTHGLIRRPHVYPGVGPKMKETEKQKQKTKTPRKNNRTPPRSTSFLCGFCWFPQFCSVTEVFVLCCIYSEKADCINMRKNHSLADITQWFLCNHWSLMGGHSNGWQAVRVQLIKWKDHHSDLELSWVVVTM